MDDEVGPSAAALRHTRAEEEPAQLDGIVDAEEEARVQEQIAKGRRLDAKRKRVAFLDQLLRDLDTLALLELITIYHLDCSFFWFIMRTLIHVTLLTPLPDLQLARQHDEHKPYLPLILLAFLSNFLLHVLSNAPSAGEDTRGYLHGGLMIDFIGQQGPTSKWKLAALDTCMLMLQLVMLSVSVKRRDLKKKLAASSGANTASSTPDDTPEGEDAPTPEGRGGVDGQTTTASTAAVDRQQDADSEERGVLRRSDTLSDTGADPDEEDALLPSSSESGHSPADALDTLSSGLSVIGEFSLIDTLLEEHNNYLVYRQTRTESGSSSGLSPTTLRQLHSIRARFGVGGG